MNSKPEISVIVPMYNVEKYIKRCIESILGQTFSDFELLLIDDGSPDNCYEICKSYVSKDTKVKLFKKDNGGLSDARNYGLEYAKGRYITFIDSDDYVTPDYLETLHSLVVKHDAEIAVANYIEVSSEDPENQITASNLVENVNVLNSREALFQLLATSRYIQMDTAWAKLIRTDIAKKHLFPVGHYHEDEATTYLYYVDSNRIVVTNKVIYAYYQNKQGIMHNRKDDKKTFDALWALVSRADSLENLGLDYEAGRAWLFVYGWLSGIVIENPENRWVWRKTYDSLMKAKTLKSEVKLKAIFFMHFPRLFAAIQKKRGKV